MIMDHGHCFVVKVVTMISWIKYATKSLLLQPRTECLETPIENPTKQTHTNEYGYNWYNTEIKVDESRQS